MYHNKTIVASIEGAAIGAALSLIEHIALWSVQDRISLTTRYALGTAAILLGLTHTCRRLGRLDLAAAGWGIAAATGAVVTGAHRLRRAQPDALDQLLKDGDSHAVWLPRARRAR